MTATLITIVAIALFFDFCNGFHDAANSIATIVSTRVLTPLWAVVWTAFFNFIAFLIFPLHVAHTIGSGVVHASVVSNAFVIAALIGAIGWDLLTWWWGLPSSSSHALVGGLIGAGIAKAGLSVVMLKGLVPIAIFIVVSPALGLVLAGALMSGAAWMFRRTPLRRVDHWFRRLQFVSAALLSLGHGGNDAQKTMGIITALLVANGVLAHHAEVPLWVVLACHAAMAVGTMAGGWRIVRTMGMRLTDLRPVHGFCAETGGAISLFLATMLGIPVSTTHVITGGIVGVGAVTHLGGVRWRIAVRVVWAWLFTIQCAALLAAAAMLIERALGYR
ncbi:MAG TPA: inorganic phosphate transporter [Polyangia bacterium]|nr:inorganic phosphate transporter [Polyangia bacterium]